jgi:hypothetical protein
MASGRYFIDNPFGEETSYGLRGLIGNVRTSRSRKHSGHP